MIDSIAHIAAALMAARKKKGLSQRALSVKAGVPQSHISKIENGEIDLQTSTLLELSRVLDLEVMLVPRQLVPAFQTLMREVSGKRGKQIPAYRLEDEMEEDDV